MNLIYRRDEEITQLFDGLLRDRTHVLKLPDNFLLLLASNQRRGKGGDGGGGNEGGSGGGEEEPPTKQQRITPSDQNEKKSPDMWSAPSTVVNPVANYFPTTGYGKLLRKRWMKITFDHHSKLRGSDDFAQTPLCLD